MEPLTQQPYFMSPTLPSTPEPEQPKSKKKLLIVVLAVIVFLLIAAILVLAVSKKSGVKNQGATQTSVATKSHVIEFLNLISDHKIEEAYNMTNSQKVSKDIFVKVSSQNLGINFKLTECKVTSETEQNNLLTTKVSCPYYKSEKQPAELTFISEQKDGMWLIDNYTIGE